MTDLRQESAVEMPEPSWLSLLAAIVLKRLEMYEPGFFDGVAEDLSSEILRAQVIRLRGLRALPKAIEDQEQLLLWMAKIAPLVKASRGVKRRRK